MYPHQNQPTLKIRRKFLFTDGRNEIIEQEWHRGWDAFGKLVQYKGRRFEWMAHEPQDYPFHHMLIYCETSKRDGYAIDEYLDYLTPIVQCECGGTKTGGGHSHWCPRRGMP